MKNTLDVEILLVRPKRGRPAAGATVAGGDSPAFPASPG